MELSPTKKALLALRKMQSKLDVLEQAKHEPIAIVGMGCRFPGANSPAEFWQLLEDGKNAITTIPGDRWNEEDRNIAGEALPRYGGFVPHLKEFDASFFKVAPREAASVDPQQRLLLEVCWEALENAAIPADKVLGSRTGVFIGIAAVDYWHQLLSRNQTEIDAYLTTGNTHSLASGRISHFFDFTGSSVSLDTACSSSLVAVHLAIKSLRDRECNMALAGGVNRLISPKVSINFSRAKMLSPDGLCKTFDESANGFVRSEGCGIVVLKRLSDAIANKDNIRAALLGSATNQDGRTSSITTPSSLSQQAVIKQALINSQITADKVSYLETHGTGTSLGDAIELEALSQVFGDNEQLILGAVKTNIGHLESAAGIASLIKAVLALEHKSIPGNLHLTNPNNKVDWKKLPFQLPRNNITWQTKESRIVGVSSFGFSGTNAHVVLQEFNDKSLEKEETTIADKNNNLNLFIISARNQKTLTQLAIKYINYLETNPNLAIEDICLTTMIGRSHFNHRLAIVVTSIADLQNKLSQYLSGETGKSSWQGRAKLTQNKNLALIWQANNQQLKDLIVSIVNSSLVASDIADVYWQIGDREDIKTDNAQNTIYSYINPDTSSWQIILSGIAQLYTLGVKIDWEVLSNEINGQKITLPTYPFQRSTYWLK